MRTTAFLIVLIIAASACHPTQTYSGTYVVNFESSFFSPDDQPEETWWLTGPVECAYLDDLNLDNPPFETRRVHLEVEGTLSPPGKYGHLGVAVRELKAVKVTSCVPLVDDVAEP